MFTIGDLLRLDELATRSLTAGVGEQRPVTWAHVCELADPWRWVAGNALVMTTGIPVPAAPDAQCTYIEGMARAGLAGVAIGERMSAPPLSEQMLARARELDFPVLETAHEQPFISLAMAVIDGNNRERQNRIRAAEALYQSLLDLPDASDVAQLLGELSEHLRGTLSLGASPVSPASPRGRVTRGGDGGYTIGLPIDVSRQLRFVPADDDDVDYGLLQHAATIVSGVLATQAALSRQHWLQGSVLLGGLFDESIPPAASAHLVSSNGVEPPFRLAAWEDEEGMKSIERIGAALEAHELRALFTVSEGRMNLLGGGGPSLDALLQELSGTYGYRIGLSESFSDLEQLADARLQTMLTLSDAREPGVHRFADRVPELPFLPTDSATRRQLATAVLGDLLAYDARGRSNLMRTLDVFLAENRSWVRASERLFVHRQTLVSRIAKIEQLTGKSFSSTSDVAVLWFSVQCAIEEGMLEPAEKP